MPLSFFLVVKDGLFSLMEKRKGKWMDEKVGIQRGVCATGLFTAEVSHVVLHWRTIVLSE